MTNQQSPLFGIGLYTVSDVARFTGASRGQISRWLFGHQRKYGNNIKVVDEPIWQPALKATPETGRVLSFLDLMETRAVNLFAEKGVSARLIRKARKIIEKDYNHPYPFSSRYFETDGKKLFFKILEKKILEEDEDSRKNSKIIEILSGQHEIHRVIEQSFIDIDWDNQLPRQWWIAGREKGIVLDPHRAFGQPIDNDSRIPVETLAMAVKANNNSFEKAAREFEVPVETVKRAHAFYESKYLQSQAAA